jgi:hypothetical protein
MDADHAETSLDPAERALGVLKGASIVVTVGPSGRLISIGGEDAIKEKLLSQFSAGDSYTKAIAGKQWDERIKESLIKGNVEQLFKIFPDSAIHVGDRWKLGSTQKDEITLNYMTSYVLKEIVDGTAVILSEGDISSANSTNQLNGTSFTSDLKGKQQGEFEMETASGMLRSNHIDSRISGTMTVMGREVPVDITITMKMDGQKLK